MLVAGVLAAWAGVGEVSAIQGRLRSGISPGYGYTGFLVAWMARNRIAALPLVSLGIAALLAGGDSLQISFGLPQAALDVLQGLLLLSTLAVLSRWQPAGAVR
jgi:simple sugar transport system permease protein